jgi:hypothetical protein
LFVVSQAFGQASVFMAHHLGYQFGIQDGELGFESLNSSAILAVHNKQNIVIGGVASLNALMGIPFNEVGFIAGYSDPKLLGTIAIKSYQSTFQGTGLGIQFMGGYTFEFQKNIAIGPSFTAGSLWAGNKQQWQFSVGVLIKQLKL